MWDVTMKAFVLHWKHLCCIGSSNTATELTRPIDPIAAEFLAEHVDSVIHTAAQTLRLLHASGCEIFWYENSTVHTKMTSIAHFVGTPQSASTAFADLISV